MAVYYVYSAAAGSNNGSSWANAFTTLTTAFATEVAGDTLYVAHDHAESTGAAVTLTSSGTIANPTKIVCVDRAGTVPPVSADRRTTASVVTTSNFNLTLGGSGHYDGIIFSAGTGATSSANLIVGAADSNAFRFDNCSLRLGITTGASKIIIGGSGTLAGTYIELNNTTMSFAATTHQASIVNTLVWRNTPSALLGTMPAILFLASSTRGGNVECIGVDLSAAGSGKTIAGAAGQCQSFIYRFIDCKLNASVTKSEVPIGLGTVVIDFTRSGSAGTNYTVHRQRISGLLIEETTIVRTGGASDGTTPIAWKVVTTANCNYSLPFECPPVAIWNNTTGSAVTATVECIAAAIMTDAEIWLEVEYLSDASSPQATIVSDARADLLATAANQTTSSATWGGSTTKFKLAVTFTAQQKGWIYGRVRVGKASATVYVDPLVTLT